jgi:hypothetical protein
LKENAFRFLLNEAVVEFEKGDEAQELVLEIPESLIVGREMYAVVKVQFGTKLSDKFYKSFAKEAVGIGIV